MCVSKDGLNKFSASFALVAKHSIVFEFEKEVEELEREEEDTEEWSPGDIYDAELLDDIPGYNGSIGVIENPTWYPLDIGGDYINVGYKEQMY